MAKNEFLGFCNGWSKVLLQRMLTNIALENITRETVDETRKKKRNKLYIKEGHCKLYASYQDFKYTHTFNQPVSIVMFKNGMFAAIIRKKKIVVF